MRSLFLYGGRSDGDEASLAGVLLAVLTIPIAMSISSVRLVQRIEMPVVAALSTSQPSSVESERREDTAVVGAVVLIGGIESSWRLRIVIRKEKSACITQHIIKECSVKLIRCSIVQSCRICERYIVGVIKDRK